MYLVAFLTLLIFSGMIIQTLGDVWTGTFRAFRTGDSLHGYFLLILSLVLTSGPVYMVYYLW